MTETTATTISRNVSPTRLPHDDLHGSALPKKETTPSMTAPLPDFATALCNPPRTQISTAIPAATTSAPWEHRSPYEQSKTLFRSIAEDTEPSSMAVVLRQAPATLQNEHFQKPDAHSTVNSLSRFKRRRGSQSLPIVGWEKYVNEIWASNPKGLERLRFRVHELQATILKVPTPVIPRGRSPLQYYQKKQLLARRSSFNHSTQPSSQQLTLRAGPLKDGLSSSIDDCSSPNATSTTAESHIEALWASDPQQLELKRAKIRELQAEIARGPQANSPATHALDELQSINLRGGECVGACLREQPCHESQIKPFLEFDMTPAHHDWEAQGQRRSSTAGSPSSRESSTSDPSSQDLDRNLFGKLLAHETRLHDKEFYSTPASFCFISEASVTEVIDMGLRVAQLTMEEDAYVYMPEVHRKWWSGGPSVVKLGTTELSDGPLGEGLPGMLSNDIDKTELIAAIKGLDELRNGRCHPGKEVFPQPLLAVDELLKRAQRVAVASHNYRRAMQIRALRDWVQQEAARCFAEIICPSVPLALDAKLPLHHQKLFTQVMAFPYRIPKEIKTAANEWGQGSTNGPRREFGQDDSFLRRINKAPFDAGTPDHQAVLRTFGAPERLATMSLDEMRSSITEFEAKKAGVKVDEASLAEEARAEAERIDQEVQDAVANGLF